MLETIDTEANTVNLNAFRQGLRELGYVEGQNVVIEYRSADGRNERFPALANELVGLKVDLLVTRGTPAVLAAKFATKTIPVVMAAIGDPLLAVTGIAHPGGNVTGFSAVVSDLSAKRVEMLKNAVPNMTRIAGLMNMGNPVVPPQWGEIEVAARSLGLASFLLDARKAEDLTGLFDEATRHRSDGIVVNLDSLMQANRRLIAELALRHRLPAIYAAREFVDAGGLMTYGPSYPDLYRRAAAYVDKILKGANPGDLPIQQPVRFELIINLKTAHAIGVQIPAAVLARADEVIQ